MKLKLMTVAFSMTSMLASGAVLATTQPAPAPSGTPADMTVVRLAGITNDRDTSVSYLNLMVGRQQSVRGISVETQVPEAGAAARVVSNNTYTLKNIESREGIVLGQGQGVKAILLQGEINSQAGRGMLTIKYLNNGLFRNYKECRIGLQRVSPKRWELVNAYDGQPVHHIEVKTWMLGISTLTHVCPMRSQA